MRLEGAEEAKPTKAKAPQLLPNDLTQNLFPSAQCEVELERVSWRDVGYAGMWMRAAFASNGCYGDALYFWTIKYSSAPVLDKQPELPSLVEAIVLEPALRATESQASALGLYAARLEAPRAAKPPARLDEVITFSLASGSSAQRALLQLAAALLSLHGVSLGMKTLSLSRLKPLLVLAAGELRLGLEGYGTKEGTVAACMLLEAAIVAFGKDAETLEAGNLEEAEGGTAGLLPEMCIRMTVTLSSGETREQSEEPKEVDVLAEGPPVTMGRSSKSTVQVQPWCRRSPGWGAGDESATTGYRTVGSRHRSEAKLAGAARERSFCDD
ncbi:Hypothetical protein (Fragment) [Durusdinium trenchii]|uniref:Uncharacterized protein n=1 Tax=Durusdinium trenchii TaxID=1381693 RepID=A0ABP0Q7T9_9DINO